MPLLTPEGVVAGFLLGDRIAGLAPLATFFFACITFSGFCVGKLAAKIVGAGDAESVTLMYFVGLRNIRAALVLILDFFPSRDALPVITGSGRLTGMQKHSARVRQSA